MSPRTNPALPERAREIFQAACELAPEDRAQYVDQACTDDASLHAEVCSLLASFDRSGGFLEGSLLDPTGAFWIGRRIGEYEIIQLLGRGGVGLVFEARQDRPHRIVALKLLRPELAGEEVRRRFDVEAELLGMLDHAGIARVFAAGTVDTELGPQSFLAMERIDGRTLLDYASTENLTVTDRVRLIHDISEAVHHAHERGVIHRDLKPGNVLIDRSGQPKVLDFGVARATNADLEVETIHTQVGQLVGTVSYMSPEQARGASEQLDARTDVYSLGVMLYQLLAGRLPLPISEMSLPEALRTLSEEEPPPLATVSSGVPADLATVVGKAIEREPARRYESAAALAHDLQRCLANEPVRARPPSTLYQLRKFTVRNRALVAGVAALIVLLTIGLIITTSGQLREQRLHLLSEKSRAHAEHAQRLSDFDAYASNLAVVEAAIVASDVIDARSRLTEAAPGLRGWEWTHLRARLDRSQELIDNSSGIESMSMSPDGRIAVTGGTDCNVRAWDLETGALAWKANLGRGFTMRAVAVSPSGDLVAAARGSWFAGRGQYGPVTLLSMQDGAEIAELKGHTDAVQAFAFHPREPILLSASSDRTVRAWDYAEERELRVVARHELDAQDVRWSPDTRWVASVAWDGRVILVDAATWETRQVIDTGERLTCLGWSPDSSQIAAGTWQGRVLVLDCSNGSLFYTEGRHVGRVEQVSFTRDGSSVLSAGADNTLQAHSLPRGTKAGRFLGSTKVVTAFSFEPETDTIVSGALDRIIRRWNANTRDVHRLTPHDEWVYDVSLSPDSRSLATVGTSAKGTQPRSSYVMIHDLHTREVELEIVIPLERALWSVDHSPDSERIATAGSVSGAMIWDAKTGELLLAIEHPDELRRAVFDPTGNVLATTCRDRRVRVWNSHTGELLLPPLSWDEHRPYTAAYAPDGRSLAVGYYGGAVALWDAHSGELIAGRTEGHSRAVYTVEFSPDGATLVTGGLDRRLQVWETETLLPIRPAIENPEVISRLCYFPDGERLALGDGSGLLRILETEQWRQVVSLRGHQGHIKGIAISADGRFVFTGSSDRSTLIWDGGSRAERLVDVLFGELVLADEVIARIESTPGLEPAEREEARALAESRRLDPTTLADLGRSVALNPGLRFHEYEAAARRSRTLLRSQQGDDGALGILGALLYRTGEFEDALQLLDRACASEDAHPISMAFQVLTLVALDDVAEARAGLLTLEQKAATEGWAEDVELLALLWEVRAALD